MRQLIRRLLTALTPNLQNEFAEEALASSALRTAWFGGLIISLVCLVFYVALGRLGEAALNASATCFAGLVLWGLRKPGRAKAIGHLSAAWSIVFFSMSALANRPAVPFNLMWLIFVPFISVLVLTPRASTVWTCVAIIAGLATFWLGDSGATLMDPQPHPLVSNAINFVAASLVSLLVTRAYDRIRRSAYEQMKVAQDLRTNFVTNLSHELRTPMNGVLGMTQSMLQSQLAPDVREQLQVIHRSGESMVRLISDLLDVAKADSGKLEVTSAPYALDEVLFDLEALYAPAAARKQLAFQVVASPGLPSVVVGDGLRVRQVLANLVHNALKFTSQGQVHIRVSAKGERLCFEVEDTGIGISPDVLPRLFRPFEQADASTTRRFGGTGLGLALVRQLVELMGGTVETRSEQGQGSTFTIWLPLVVLARGEAMPLPALAAADIDRAHEVTQPQAAPVAKSGRTLLLVDDNPINLAVAKRFSILLGYSVQTAANGLEALAWLERQPFDAVLMDCHMPELDGLEATRRLRAQGRRTPVIAVTASIQPEEVQACRDAGMDWCLSKPLSLGALREALEKTAPRNVNEP